MMVSVSSLINIIGVTEFNYFHTDACVEDQVLVF